LSTTCEGKDKGICNLNLALQLITDVRDNFPVCPSPPLPIDCEEVLQRDFKAIPNPIDVYCDMVTDGGGWTVIQRRGDFHGPIDYFYKDWQSYKKGFGDIEKEFWLGNENIFGLSNQRYALYDTFANDDEDHKYMLHISGYKGDAGDSMIGVHNEQKFSTKDKNDNFPGATSCAQLYKGGWWYNQCHVSNLNGQYLKSYADGVIWRSWKGYHESLGWTEIKIKDVK
uniref:Techylectin-like protein (Fragments) n=1 Tax=Phoneutria nigriventer TaxID=6918 RepID=TLLP_PHONI|nr:RecName: Full=Techylectin-like protein [Phoneutria nigriventer]